MWDEFWLTLEYVLTGSSDAVGSIHKWRQLFFLPSTLSFLQYISYNSENNNLKFEGMDHNFYSFLLNDLTPEK